jgi:hypothetical protein
MSQFTCGREEDEPWIQFEDMVTSSDLVEEYFISRQDIEQGFLSHNTLKTYGACFFEGNGQIYVTSPLKSAKLHLQQRRRR